MIVVLTGLLWPIAMLGSDAHHDHKPYTAWLLLLQAGVMGSFLSLDLFLFFVFFEIVLVPMYFIIAIWGGPRRVYSAIKFVIYTLFGSILMLLGILTLYFQHFKQFGYYTFEVSELMKLDLPLGLQQWVFWAFFLGFAIKVENGSAPIPDAPGLGVELDEDAVARFVPQLDCSASTRFPVIGPGGVDDVQGIISAKDLLVALASGWRFQSAAAMRPYLDRLDGWTPPAPFATPATRTSPAENGVR